MRSRSFVRDNGLSLFFGVAFLIALVGQALSGWHVHNSDLAEAGVQQVTLARYVSSSEFAVDVSENWQSEYLQFLLYIMVTVWLVQRGSPESKEAGNEGRGDDVGNRWGGLRGTLYARSLGLAMGSIFLASWFVQYVTGRVALNSERVLDGQLPFGWGAYLTSAEFWSRTLQNWQSEFLAVGSMAVFGIYLRQRGSPESKPVDAPAEATGATNS